MRNLAGIIAQLIDADGPLPVADYMELALQHPEFGYYRHGDPLGRGGDFITAPEISQMFGEMIGLWCADVWRQMGEPPGFTLLELGPGRGTLMADALRATAKINGFQAALKLHLMESSVTLRAMQAEKLTAYAPVYIDDFAQLPPQPVIAVANEFFDALPVRQFERVFQGWCERMVVRDGDRLALALRPVDPALMMLIPPALRDAPPGTVHEVSLQAMSVLRDLAKHIARHGGALLAVDYGYTESDGKPTVQAVAGHRYADVLDDPGNVDITALVDFTSLARAAMSQNARAHGPVGQGEFLQTLGIEIRAIQLKQRATPLQAQDIDSALHRLTDPSQMGTLFKVMAVTSPQLAELPGF